MREEVLMEALFDHCNKLVREYCIAVEGFTNQQIAEAIKQMVLAGDFVRYVHKQGGLDHAQAIVYSPYQDKLRLQNRLTEAEAQLAEIKSMIGKIRWLTE